MNLDPTKIFKAFLERGLINFKKGKAYDETKIKPSWYIEDNFCLYHRVKGHSIDGCISMKIKLHKLLENGEITFCNN